MDIKLMPLEFNLQIVGAGELAYRNADMLPNDPIILGPLSFMGGFTDALGGDTAVAFASNKQHCPITNNCQGGNCVAGCNNK